MLHRKCEVDLMELEDVAALCELRINNWIRDQDATLKECGGSYGVESAIVGVKLRHDYIGKLRNSHSNTSIQF
jgi:hypothetical protein